MSKNDASQPIFSIMRVYYCDYRHQFLNAGLLLWGELVNGKKCLN